MKIIQKNNYAKGGSLKEHGIEEGDTFIKTIMGGIQKVKDKNGKIVYIDLSRGERDSQPPLPFDNGGGIGIEEDIDMTDDNRVRVGKPAMPTRKLSNQELAEKHNASAYEFMQENKKAFGGSLFSKAKIMAKPSKYPNLEGKQVFLKNGKIVQVFSQSDSDLRVLELGKIGSGERPHLINISEVDTSSFKNGGALIGNQKRIDLNKNGKIDAEDFKLLRSSMNGAWRNERKHVNHNEDYEVRYAKKKPSRTGYKGKRNFAEGGGVSNLEIGDNVTIIKPFPNADMTGKKAKVVELTKNNTGVVYISVDGKRIAVLSDYISKDKKLGKGGGVSNFERLSRVVAKNYEGKQVKPKYQKEYGKVYSKSEAKEVGKKVAGKVKAMQKAESGVAVKKGNRGGVMVLAKKIRKDGESWKDALKRAGQQLK